MEAFTRIKTKDVFLQPSGYIAVCIDWQEKTITTPIGEVDGYICRRVDVAPGDLTADKVIEMFVRERYSQSEEFALINAYNASVNDIDKNEAKEQEYLEFLSWRKQMKDEVKAIIRQFFAENPADTFPEQPELPVAESEEESITD